MKTVRHENQTFESLNLDDHDEEVDIYLRDLVICGNLYAKFRGNLYISQCIFKGDVRIHCDKLSIVDSQFFYEGECDKPYYFNAKTATYTSVAFEVKNEHLRRCKTLDVLTLEGCSHFFSQCVFDICAKKVHVIHLKAKLLNLFSSAAEVKADKVIFVYNKDRCHHSKSLIVGGHYCLKACKACMFKVEKHAILEHVVVHED